MFVFGYDTNMAGTYVGVKIDTSAAHGVYMEFKSNARLPNGVEDSMLVTSVSFAEKEKYHIVDCFNDVAHTYGFGHDAQSSIITVGFLGFLGPNCAKKNSSSPGEAAATQKTPYDSLNKMLTTYSQNRLSKNTTQINLHMGKLMLPGFLVSLRSGTSNVDYNLQSYTMELLSVSVIEPHT